MTRRVDNHSSADKVETTWTTFDTPCEAVVTAVAVATNEEITDLDPIYRTVDPDALNSLATTAGESPSSGVGQISFTYSECMVTLYHDGRLTIT